MPSRSPWATDSHACGIALTTSSREPLCQPFLLAFGCCSSEERQPCLVVWKRNPLFLLHLVAAEDEGPSYPELEFTKLSSDSKDA